MSGTLLVTYHVKSDARSVDDRARGIAVEQSVEMPVSGITDEFVLSEIVGRVQSVRALESGWFEVRVALSAQTIGTDAGQMINMLFGNTSMQDDVILHDVEFPPSFATIFGGPRHGLQGLRQRAGARTRALTCSALKPQGVPPARLADMARKFAQGGIDYIKDDHSLAEQAYSPFEARVTAIADALRSVARPDRPAARYVPSLSGDLDSMRRQIAFATQAGIDTVMVAPMIAGAANFHALVRQNPDVAFFTHPTMAGAARIAPQLLFGKIFRLLGGDAIVFPNHGGRFGYTAETCRELAHAARTDWHGLRPSIPVPAGGMTLDRVPGLLDFYGPESMLLIGGDLLKTPDRLVEATAAFVAQVQRYSDG